MQDTASGIVEFGPSDCPEHHLVTARSHLIDRFVPACEIIRLPSKKVGGGALTYARKHHVAAAPVSGKRSRLPFRKASGVQRLDDGVYIDFRRRNPQNWAHFLNNHLPICFALMDQTGLSAGDVVLILPANTPGFIVKAAAFFGLRTLCTADSIEGEGVEFTSEPWTGIRSVRAQWARLPHPRSVLTGAGIHGAAPDDHLPRKVFLSRRDTRNLENEAAVETHLAKRGYAKIYPEELSVADQIMLFEQADSMVAIHGAGLAPLLYLSEEARLTQLIELFPCGHMTDVYRVMSDQVGCRWIGVRGKIKPEHVTPAYDLENPFLEYSLQSFELDLTALDLAFELIEKEPRA